MAATITTITDIFESYSAGFRPKPEQESVLSYIYENPDRDVIVSWPTGYGKSCITHLCGQIIERKTEKKETITLCIAPLTLIQEDQMAEMKKRNIPACKLDITGSAQTLSDSEDDYESEDYTDDDDDEDVGRKKTIQTDASFKDIVSGRYRVVLAHPEALLCTEFGDRLMSNKEFVSKVNVLVVDECHTIDQWGDNFREAFGMLHHLPAIFQCPVVALSATLTKKMLSDLPAQLGLSTPKLFRISPDNPHVFYEMKERPSNMDIMESQEFVYVRELEKLHEPGPRYPVTLLYMSLDWISNAQAHCITTYGRPSLATSKYGVLFSAQDEKVKKVITQQLKMKDPNMRLVMCSGTIGMGFDSPCVTRVVHGRPPRTMIDLVQQVGRAGRKGQPSKSLIYFNRSDIAPNMPVSDDIRELCQTKTCLREYILGVFGFEKDEQLFPSECACCVYCKEKCKCGLCNM